MGRQRNFNGIIAHTANALPARSRLAALAAIVLGFGITMIATPAFGQTTGSATSRIGAGDYAAQLQRAQTLEGLAYQTQSISDYRAAAAAMEACSRIHPEDMSLHRSLGYLYLEKLNQPKLAYPHLEAVYAATPDGPGWGQLLAKDLGELGRLKRQIQVLQDTVKRNPRDPWARLDLADALTKAGRFAEAERAFQYAVIFAPGDEWVSIRYAEFLYSRGRISEAETIAKGVLATHPKSAGALALLGDIDRSNWNLDKAKAEYAQAMIDDPSYYTAKSGLNEVQRSQSPQFQPTYYLFKGTDGFYQTGLFNTLTAPVSDHIFVNANFDVGWYENDQSAFKTATRFEEGLGLEDRLDNVFSLQGGASGFQVTNHDIAGFNVGATWKPTKDFWAYASYRFDDPVNDSITTVSEGFTQNVIGLSGGYQFTDDISTTITASHAFYSDGNNRNFLHIEPTYMLWALAQLRVGAVYEVIDYGQSVPDYSSPHWYQTYGPLIEAEPYVFSWLSVHARIEPVFVAQAYRWGINVTTGPSVHLLDNRFEGTVEYLYSDVPGSFVNYSGSGFRAMLSYRF
jgi:tetratricopeptide (TPR) repeat protein